MLVRPWILAFAILGLTWPLATQAAVVRVDRGHNAWQTALPLDLSKQEQVRFGVLQGDGDSRVYHWTGQADQHLRIYLEVPNSTAEKFAPRLVVFSPDSITAGPVLPIEQPANTLATIYPGMNPTKVFSWLTQSGAKQLVAKELRLPADGDYYAAVYTASSTPGRYQLRVVPRQIDPVAAWLTYPRRWWFTQIWAGWSWGTVLLPILVLLIVVAAIWPWIKHHLVPPKIS